MGQNPVAIEGEKQNNKNSPSAWVSGCLGQADSTEGKGDQGIVPLGATGTSVPLPQPQGIPWTAGGFSAAGTGSETQRGPHPWRPANDHGDPQGPFRHIPLLRAASQSPAEEKRSKREKTRVSFESGPTPRHNQMPQTSATSRFANSGEDGLSRQCSPCPQESLLPCFSPRVCQVGTKMEGGRGAKLHLSQQPKLVISHVPRSG